MMRWLRRLLCYCGWHDWPHYTTRIAKHSGVVGHNGAGGDVVGHWTTQTKVRICRRCRTRQEKAA
jgi:hypothetical protein